MAKSNKAGKIITGAGITAAIAAAAAGAYFLYGTKEGKKQRKKLESWGMKMKKETVAQMKKLKKVNEKEYHKVVDTVTKRFKNLKDVDPQELAQMARELKAYWKNIKREFQSDKRKVKKVVKKAKSRNNGIKKH